MTPNNLVSLTAMIFGTALAFGAQGADLISVYRDAQQQDPTLGSARAAWAAAQEALPQGRAGLLPAVAATANSTYNNDEIVLKGDSPLDMTRRFNSNGIGVTATQPLFRAQNFLTYQEAKIQVQQADYLLAAAELDLLLRVTQAYFDVLLAQDNVVLTVAQKSAITENLAQAKRNFEVGTATITDTNDAQARFDQTVAQEISAQNDLEIKRRALQAIIGTLPENLKSLGAKIDLKMPSPNQMDDWVTRAEQHNYSVLSFQAALQIADYEIDRNRAGHLPTVDLVAGYNDAYASGSISTLGGPSIPNDLKSKIVGVQLTLPLYAGGSVNSKVRQAIANRDKARQDLEFNRRGAAQSARTAFLGVVNGIAQVRALEQAVVSSETALASAQLGMQVGVRTNLDVLNSQQQVYSARRDLYQARYNYLINVLKLRASVGELTEAQVEEINRMLVAG